MDNNRRRYEGRRDQMMQQSFNMEQTQIVTENLKNQKRGWKAPRPRPLKFFPFVFFGILDIIHCHAVMKIALPLFIASFAHAVVFHRPMSMRIRAAQMPDHEKQLFVAIADKSTTKESQYIPKSADLVVRETKRGYRSLVIFRDKLAPRDKTAKFGPAFEDNFIVQLYDPIAALHEVFGMEPNDMIMLVNYVGKIREFIGNADFPVTTPILIMNEMERSRKLHEPFHKPSMEHFVILELIRAGHRPLIYRQERSTKTTYRLALDPDDPIVLCEKYEQLLKEITLSVSNGKTSSFDEYSNELLRASQMPPSVVELIQAISSKSTDLGRQFIPDSASLVLRATKDDLRSLIVCPGSYASYDIVGPLSVYTENFFTRPYDPVASLKAILLKKFDGIKFGGNWLNRYISPEVTFTGMQWVIDSVEIIRAYIRILNLPIDIPVLMVEKIWYSPGVSYDPCIGHLVILELIRAGHRPSVFFLEHSTETAHQFIMDEGDTKRRAIIKEYEQLLHQKK